MDIEHSTDPRQYLNRVDRLLVGWMVIRIFKANTPKFEKWVERSGPRVAALSAGVLAYRAYGAIGIVAAVVFTVARLEVAAQASYALMGVLILLMVAGTFSSFKAQREYRKSHRNQRIQESAE